MSNPFFFDDRADVAISQLRDLADALTRIRDGGPTADDLADAPVLDRFVIVPRMRPSLAGIAAGHPVLSGDRIIRTSELFAIDSDAGWARTYSRFYRLGRPGGAARGRDQ